MKRFDPRTWAVAPMLATSVVVGLTVCGCAATGQTAQTVLEIEYPATKSEQVSDTLHGVEVADPYRWLEDASNPEVQAWLAAQDSITRETLARRDSHARFRERLAELAYYDSVSVPIQRGGRYFYNRRHADREKRVYYWRDGLEGAENVLLDPNTMGTPERPVSIGQVIPDHQGRRVAYTLKENNADAAVLYVMDVATGKHHDVDTIAGAKYASPAWTPQGDGFYYTWLPTDPTIPLDQLPGHAQIRYHPLGSDPAGDRVIRPETNDPTLFANVDLSEDGRWLMTFKQRGWTQTHVTIEDLQSVRAKKIALTEGLDARFQVIVHEGQMYLVTDYQAPNKRVLRVDPRRPQPSNWTEVIAESDAAIRDVQLVGGHLVVSYLRNAASELQVFDLNGKPVRRISLPAIGTVRTISGNQDAPELFFDFSSFAQPAQVYRTDVATGQTEIWFKTDLPIDPSQIVTEQVWYPSKDGTKISMFVVHRKDVERTPQTPLLLFGYGGFDVSLTPRFAPRLYPWLEAGGIYAVPNLRGGGEYGRAWHEAGMLANKQNVFDDYIAAAEWLIENEYTSSEKLAIYGRSNGGLLVGAAMTQRPDLFRTVLCGVPLLDMVRYHKFGSGRTWIPEYGSADVPEQFPFIHAYSPYHRVDPDTVYPSMLMLTADADDRVDPMHARKFTAAIQAAQSRGPVLLRMEKNAGHSGAGNAGSMVDKWADVYAFLTWQLGMS